MTGNPSPARGSLPDAALARPVGYFDEASAAFQRACDAAGCVERTYRVAGLAVRLRFAGPALLSRITPALAHLTAPAPTSTDDALTVCLWDAASTGATMPPPAWGAGDYLARGEIRGFNGGRIRTVYNPGDGAFRMIDLERRRALFWVAAADEVPYDETGAPLRAILHWWLSARQRPFVHAAAVATPAGGALLAGRGGSGKSTAALACVSAGFAYAGDDYVALGLEPVPFVHSLYSTAKVDAGQLASLPELAEAVANRTRLDREKALLFLHDHRPSLVRAGFPVQVLLVPRISGQPGTRWEPAPAAAGVRALAPTTIFQLPGAGGDTFEAVVRFARRLPCYWLHVGRDLSSIPRAVEAILERSAGFRE